MIFHVRIGALSHRGTARYGCIHLISTVLDVVKKTEASGNKVEEQICLIRQFPFIFFLAPRGVPTSCA